jgi:hypothetical protein
MQTNQPINITLLSFNKTVSLNTGGLIFNEIYNPQFDSYDAIANVDIDLNTFKNMFCFQTDYIDVNDATETDIKYYVLSQKLSFFNPSLGSSIVITNPISPLTSTGTTEIDQLIGKDFTRFLSSLLFNTPYGADLFVNEEELVNSVSLALSNAWSYCLTDLQNVSNEGNNPNIPLIGNSPAKYLTNAYTEVKNICRELFLQVISKAPERFTNLPQIPVDDYSATQIREGSNFKYYYLPLIHNDIIQLRVKLYPSVTQPTFGLPTTDTTKFETVGNDTHLKGRTYLINMKLINNLIVSNQKLSFKVVGKNSTLSTVYYLPIITNNNILNITTVQTQINSNTIQTDIYYNVDLTINPSASILDVGFGFSQNAVTWYNNNIESIEITKFGGIPLYGRGSQFKGLSSTLKFTATDVPLISPGTSLAWSFANMPNFNEIVNFLGDLSNVTNMSNMFSGCTIFNNGSTTNNGLNPIRMTVSSSLQDMSYMFSNCQAFNQRTTLFQIMSGVTTMEGMFSGCTIFNNGNTTNAAITGIYITSSNVLVNTSRMFLNCKVFNQLISLFPMTKVTTMESMFSGCTIFNNGNITNSGTMAININSSNVVVNTSNMFLNCKAFNQQINITRLTKLTTSESMFSGCSIFNNGSITNNGLSPLSFPNPNVLITAAYMFLDCTSLNQQINTSNITGITSGMFNGCTIFNNGVI